MRILTALGLVTILLTSCGPTTYDIPESAIVIGSLTLEEGLHSLDSTDLAIIDSVSMITRQHPNSRLLILSRVSYDEEANYPSTSAHWLRFHHLANSINMRRVKHAGTNETLPDQGWDTVVEFYLID